MLTGTTTAIDTYTEAWAERDAAARLALLERCWAEDGVYCDPLGRAEGRPALSDLIAGFQAQQPGARIEVVSEVDEHHGFLRFTWRMRGPDGAVAIEGTDFGEVDEQGLLRRIVGFFGEPAARGS